MPDNCGTHISARLAALAAEMRLRGAQVGVADLMLAHRASAAIDPLSRLTVFAALRTVLCSSLRDIQAFDAAFKVVFDLESPDRFDALDPSEDWSNAETINGGGGTERPDDIDEAASVVAGDQDELRFKDFADYTDEELAAASRIVARLAAATPTRASRRARATARGRRGRPDVHRSLRSSIRTGGVGKPVWTFRGARPRRIVLVVDASGSMERYARVLLQLLGTWVRTGRSVEAFVFATRLTRITRDLAGPDYDTAFVRAQRAVTDWGSGTQIGASLGQLNREYGQMIGRGAIALVMSDGWDRGHPDLLSAELQRLRRSVHALVWLNPHAADPAFEPLTQGMRLVLPEADQLLAGNCIHSLQQLASLLHNDLRFSIAARRRGKHCLA
jgi:uncharacterized protein with von Willebrand factor type A (vWA) domain